MPEGLCARCHTEVLEEEKTCPLCGADLRRLFAVRRRRRRRANSHGAPIGPPRLGSDEPQEVLRPRFVVRGLMAGSLAGTLFGLPCGILAWSLLSAGAGSGTPAGVATYVALLLGGMMLGAVMGHEEDFTDAAALWAVCVLIAIYIGLSLVIFRLYHLIFAAGAAPFVQRYLVGWFYRMFWGESWDIG